MSTIDPSKVQVGDVVTLEDLRDARPDGAIIPDPAWSLTGRVREIHVTHTRADATPFAWKVRIGHTPYPVGTAEWTYTVTAHQPAPDDAEVIERVRMLADEWESEAERACYGADHNNSCPDCIGHAYASQLRATLDPGTETTR